MDQYKLIYFNLRGRGEVIRLLFIYTGHKYEDARVQFSDWPAMKETTPIGKLPILEIRNQKNNLVASISQSRAIGRYLANKFNLAGKTDLEKAKADEIVDQVNDEIDMFGNVQQSADREKKMQEFLNLLNTIVPFNLKYIENILSTSKSGYLVGDGLTWADFSVMSKWDILPDKDSFFKDFPLVKQHDEKIRSIPKIADWLKKRPVSKI